MADDLNIKLEIEDGEHVLRVLRFGGSEAISQLSSIDIDFVFEHEGALPDTIGPGAAATLVLSRGEEQVRAVHGIIQCLDVNLDGGGGVSYRAVLVPRAWRAKLVKQQRIFLDASILEVARTKLESVGLTGDDIVENTLSSYPAREFIVQYQEHDLDFIGRLTEWAGVAFYIDHQFGKDRLVFVDHAAGFIEHVGEPLSMSTRLDEPNRVQELASQYHLGHGLAMVYDYNYRTPDVTLKAVGEVPSGHGGGILEYPTHVKTQDDAKALAAIRAEEIAVHQKPYQGRSNIVELCAGLRIPFSGNDHIPAVELLITSVEHAAEPSEGSPDHVVYSNRFTAVRADLPFRPRRLTPRPSINGILTAIVQGTGSDSGTRAIIDEHGRYVVQFHFDQALGSLNLKASRAVRMSQSFTGSGEGMHFPLKPGVEVAVAFMDGDPDRPIIVGALPNHTQPSVVTASNSTVNKITTDNGITIKFGRLS